MRVAWGIVKWLPGMMTDGPLVRAPQIAWCMLLALIGHQAVER